MHSVYISLTTTYKAFSLFFGILSNLVIAAQQVPQSAEFPRQEYWNGLPFPSPGDFPDPGIELVSLMSPALAGITTKAAWEALSPCNTPHPTFFPYVYYAYHVDVLFISYLLFH